LRWAVASSCAGGSARRTPPSLRSARGSPASTLAAATVAATVVYAIAGPIDLLDGDWHGISRAGMTLVLAAAVYAALSGLVFPIGRLRDFTTLLWSEALLVAIAAAAFLFDGTATVVAWVALGLGLVGLSVLLDEKRFQLGAAVCLVLATFHAVVLDAPPTRFFESNSHPASGAVAAAAHLALVLARVAVVPVRFSPPRAFWGCTRPRSSSSSCSSSETTGSRPSSSAAMRP
jgi:hypothetical protein